jgi:hypothetical protein
MILVALVVVLVLLIAYRVMTDEKPKTVALTYTRGAVATSRVRQGLASRTEGSALLDIFLEQRRGKYPGVSRYIFLMENPAPKPKPVVTHVTATPPVHIKTPQEIATEAALAAARAMEVTANAVRADLNKFQFLGYLTEKDNTLFLSKEGELFIVKKGDTIIKSYKVKEVSKNYVVLIDTKTGVEVRLELSGGDMTASPPIPRAQQQVTPQPHQQAPQQLPMTQLWQQQRRPATAPLPGTGQ